MTSFRGQSIGELGEGLRAGRFTAVDLARDTLERIEALNPSLHAFVALSAERALAEAKQATDEMRRGNDRGPLHGIPYAAKDLFDVAGMATTAQSRLLANNIATRDSTAVARLADAGAVLVGKVATYEHAIEPWPSPDGLFPPARHPLDPDRITGGSSSGSAVAVAAGLVRFALGTDTGGSVRSPAGYCGIVGMKPSYNAIPCDGVFPLSPSLDHVGVLAASVGEAALVFGAIAERQAQEQDPVRWEDDLHGLTIGYARRFFEADAPAEFMIALDEAASRLDRLGADVVEVELPPYELFEACGRVILQAEAFQFHAKTLSASAELYGPAAFRSLVSGAVLSADDLLAGRQVQAMLRQAVDETVFARCDAMLTANVLATAPRMDEIAMPGRRWTPMRTFPFNVTGHPALALPVGLATDGLPMGVQLVGPSNGEAALLRVAAALEQSLAVAIPNSGTRLIAIAERVH